jgi:phosphohistidine phosphatase
MKMLYLLRHAKSSWKDTLLADHDRPINGRGRDEAPLLGEYLRQRGLTPAFVAVSTARRAIQTASEVLSILHYDGLVRHDSRLYLAEIDTLYAVIASTPAEAASLMLVAHNPGLEQLLAALTGQATAMPTCCLAQIELALPSWPAIGLETQGQLLETWRPAIRR